jgi:hypothetical protein
MSDIWTDRLSEFLDGDLTPAEQLALEQHLAGCDVCRATLAELKEVVCEAGALRDVGPARDLWPAVAASVTVLPRRATFSTLQLIAAGTFIALVSGLSMWVLVGRDRLDGREAIAGSGAVTVDTAAAAEPYDRAVADLLRALDEGRAHLGPRTIDVVERNLGTIDRAIAEASAALDQDPGNLFVSVHLARARQRKLALLRQVQSLAETP